MSSHSLIVSFLHSRQIKPTDQLFTSYHSLNQRDIETMAEFPNCTGTEHRLREYSEWLDRNRFDPVYRIMVEGGRGLSIFLGGLPRG